MKGNQYPNRRERRKASKPTKDEQLHNLRERNEALEIMLKNVAPIIEAVGTGKQIALSDQVDNTQETYTPEEVDRILDERIRADFLYAERLMPIAAAQGAIQAAAACDNGKRTRKALSAANGDLMKAIDGFDDALDEVQRMSSVGGDEVLIRSLADEWRALHQAVKRFLRVRTDVALDELRIYLEQNGTPALRELLINVYPARGRRSKENEWLTVEFERRLKVPGATGRTALDSIVDELEAKPPSDRTDAEKDALIEINNSDDPVKMLLERVRRRKKGTAITTK